MLHTDLIDKRFLKVASSQGARRRKPWESGRPGQKHRASPLLWALRSDLRAETAGEAHCPRGASKRAEGKNPTEWVAHTAWPPGRRSSLQRSCWHWRCLLTLLRRRLRPHAQPEHPLPQHWLSAGVTVHSGHHLCSHQCSPMQVGYYSVLWAEAKTLLKSVRCPGWHPRRGKSPAAADSLVGSPALEGALCLGDSECGRGQGPWDLQS